MTEAPLLSIENLTVKWGSREVVSNLSLAVQRGERVAIVGESGSGKTVTALSILRLLRNASMHGQIRFNGRDLLALPEDQLRQVRGRDIAMVFQEPMSALNPLHTIGSQIGESLELHEGVDRKAARARAIELLAATGVREPERRVDSLPHQLSGGQRQRAVIAMALACRPRLLIADEPTTALDVRIRARILRLLREIQERESLAVLLITHDLQLVRQFAERVAVMEAGRLVEVAPTEQLFESPQESYTRKLLDSRPVREVVPVPADSAPPKIRVEGLRVEYRQSRPGLRGRLRPGTLAAVDGVDFSLRSGETLGILGESGSGKSTLALAVLGLIRPSAGSLEFDGVEVPYSSKAWQRLRARVQVVFQDPFGSLSPRRNVEQIVGEGLALHRPELDARARRDAVVAMLEEVGIPATALMRYPHEFSGGQRQRIAIARAVVLEPLVVVLDEPTSALDASIQRQVLALLSGLQRRHKLSYVLISHDIAVVHALAHQVIVMKEGRVVESGETDAVLLHPRHEYTRSLVEASGV